MKLVCDIITPAIERLAEKNGISKEVACTAVSVWKSKNNTSEYPTDEQFKQYLQDSKKELEELELAVPTYESHEFEESKPLTWHENGTIHLRKLPSSNPLEYFFNKYGDEFRKYVRTTEEVYQVMLWNEMYNVQHDTNDNVESKNNALKKAKKYNEKHPLVISDYTQEMQDIKTKAIANGTFMKAPNGKPTNLTERQWLQVRTKAFKEWFGDWQTLAEQDVLMPIGTSGSGKSTWIKSLPNLNNYVIISPDEMRVEFTGDMNNKTKDDEIYQEAAKRAVKAIKQGKKVIFDTTNLKKDRRTAFTNAIYAEIPNAKIAYKLMSLNAELAKQRIKNDIESGKNRANVSPETIDRHAASYPKMLDDIKSEKPTVIETDDVSKVVDENGEPLVVYHHTDNPNLTEFSTDFENYFAKDGGTKEAIFFDENKTGTLGRRYDIPVFLNIRELNEYNETKQQLHDRGTTYREVVNQSAKNNNKNGGVHMKDFDDNRMEHQSIWIVHNPNQIKSATDNTGIFSREDNNIYRGRTILDTASETKMQQLTELQAELDLYTDKLNTLKSKEGSKRFINNAIKQYNASIDSTKKSMSVEGNITINYTEYKDIIKGLNDRFEGLIKPITESGYHIGTQNDRTIYKLNKISIVKDIDGMKAEASKALKVAINGLQYEIDNINKEIKALENASLQEIIDNYNLIDTSVYHGVEVKGEVKKTIDDKKDKLSTVGVKVDKDYQQTIIEHLKNDKLSYTDIERERLIDLANALFDYFNKNDFKIRVVTRPYSEAEKRHRSSAVTTSGKYATIYYVKQDNQESPFITLLHELLHIATNDALPFDAMGRAIEDEQLQRYYDAFVSHLSSNPEYMKYSFKLMNAKNMDEYNSVPYKYRVLYHATESVGEFLSSFLNEQDVRNEVSSITYGEGRSLFEWLRDKIEEFLSKLFKGYSYIQETEVLSDITNFLLNYQYQGSYNEETADEKFVSEYKKYQEELNVNFNNALDYKDVVKPKPELQEITITYTPKGKDKPTTEIFDERIKKPLLTESKIRNKGYFQRGDVKMVYNFSNDLVGKNNQPVAIQRQTKGGVQTINIDLDLLKEKFNQKAWTQSQTLHDNTKAQPLAEDTFNTFDEWLTFAILHEYYHTQRKINEGESRGEYETVINNLALQDLKNNYTPSTSAQISDIQPTKPENTYNPEEIKEVTNPKVQTEVKEVNVTEAENTDNLPKPGSNYMVQPSSGDKVSMLNNLWDKRTLRLRTDMLAREFIGSYNKVLEEEKERISEELTKVKNQNEVSELNYIMNIYNSGDLKAIISQMGADKIYVDMLNSLKEKMNNSEGNIAQEYKKVIDNIQLLLNKTFAKVEEITGVRITADDINMDFNVTDTLEDTDNTEETDGDDEEGKRTDEIFGGKNRMKNPFSTYSTRLKFMLGNLPLLDSEGNIQTDDLGNMRYMSGLYAYVCLLGEFQKVLNSDDFATKNDDGTYNYVLFDKIRGKYPWVEYVESTLDEDTSMLSEMYTGFRLDFVKYSTQYIDSDGSIKSRILNEQNAEEGTMQKVIEAYESGIPVNKATSIYNSDGTINKDNVSLAKEESKEFDGAIEEEDYEEATEHVNNMLSAIGFNVPKEVINNMAETEEGHKELLSIVNNADKILAHVPKKDEHLIESNMKYYRAIAKTVGLVDVNDTLVTSFRGDDGKEMYSYSAPCYIDTVAKIINDRVKRKEFLQNEFKKYSWFYQNGWRSKWLEFIDKGEFGDGDIFATKEVKAFLGTPYEKMDATELKAGIIREYFSVPWNEKSKQQYAYYNMPIFSDSTAIKFIRFTRYTTDDTGTFEDKVLDGMKDVVLQELSRFNLLSKRKRKGVSKITNFDSKGRKFCFIPRLNDNFVSFVTTCYRLANAGKYSERDAFIKETLRGIMEEDFENFLLQDIDKASLMKDFFRNGIITEENEALFDDKMKEYFYNSVFATSQIIEIFTTDLAFYKDDIDFQKRWKQVYASGYRPFTNSKYARKTRKTIYISDKIATSGIYSAIKKVLQKAVQEKRITAYDMDNILNKFMDVNVADAQCFITLDSMRAVLDMTGKWTNQMEETFQRLQKGDWDMSDFNTIWQTLKPFVYTQVEKPNGLGGSMKVPHHNKNSEFLLLAAYTMVANSLSDNNTMKGLQTFMQDNNIDAIQFESAVKVGGQGIININYSKRVIENFKKNNPKQWDNIYTTVYNDLLEEYGKKEDVEQVLSKYTDADIYKEAYNLLLKEGKISQEDYNKAIAAIEPTENDVYNILTKYAKVQSDEAKQASQGIYGYDENGNPLQVNDLKRNVVTYIPYEDYMIQQPTPEHLFDNTEAVYGSQIRNLNIADIPEGTVINVNGKNYSKEELLALHDSLLVENLSESYEKVANQINDIDRLSEMLVNLVKSSGKYSSDTINALSVITDPVTGQKRFNIPLNNTLTSEKIQQLILSVFKKKITQQKIRGGSAILVSDIGYTDKLHIVRNENGGIEGFECLLPATSKRFFKPFLKTSKDGTYQYLDIQRMQKECPELLRAIGYRIPTEDKYSMAPLIIKGFLPQQNGSSIMLPHEITTIAGCDFDVDKMFLMLYEFGEQKYDTRRVKEDFEKENKVFEELQSIFKGGEADFDKIDNPTWKKWWSENKKNYLLDRPRIFKIKYDASKPASQNTRQARNNMLIDIMRSVLCSPVIEESMYMPGNFDTIKTYGRISDIITNKRMWDSFKKEYNLSDDEAIKRLLTLGQKKDFKALDKFLKKYKPYRNPLSVDNFVYFHQQNMTGAMLIGVYANNTTMHAKYQRTSLAIPKNRIFSINGRTIESLHSIYNGLGERISKNCSEFSAASVDNAKDPVLARLLQNGRTAGLTCFMLRAGLTIEEISLVFAQPCIRLTLDKNKDLKTTVGQYLKRLTNYVQKKYGSQVLSQNYAITSTGLIKNTVGTLTPLEDFYITRFIYNMLVLTDKFSDVTSPSRADSPNGAIAHTISGVMLQQEKVRRLAINENLKDGLPGMSDGLQNGIININTPNKNAKLMSRKLPHLQAFYSYGIELPLQLISPYFPQLNSKVRSIADTIIEIIPDKSLRFKSTERTLNNLFKAATYYSLSSTKMFGNDDDMTYTQKQKYYTEKFPEIFNKMKQDATNNKGSETLKKIFDLGLFQKLEVRNNKIIFDRSGRLTQMMRDLYTDDMDQLLYLGEEANQLAFDLLAYSYYADKLDFSTNSFGSFFNTQFLNSFPQYIEALNNVNNLLQDPEMYLNLLRMYVVNNKSVLPKFNEEKFEELSNTDAEGNYHLSSAIMKNPFGITSNVYRYIMVGPQLYECIKDSDTEAVYKPIPSELCDYNVYTDVYKEAAKVAEKRRKTNVVEEPISPDKVFEEETVTPDEVTTPAEEDDTASKIAKQLNEGKSKADEKGDIKCKKVNSNKDIYTL